MSDLRLPSEKPLSSNKGFVDTVKRVAEKSAERRSRDRARKSLERATKAAIAQDRHGAR